MAHPFQVFPDEILLFIFDKLKWDVMMNLASVDHFLRQWAKWQCVDVLAVRTQKTKQVILAKAGELMQAHNFPTATDLVFRIIRGFCPTIEIKFYDLLTTPKQRGWSDRGHYFSIGISLLGMPLGKSTESSNPVLKNNTMYAQAYFWIRYAAHLGDAQAVNMVATCYNQGWYVERDLCRSFKLYTRASHLGLNLARINVGLCLWDGEGCQKNRHLASQIFHSVDKKGDWETYLWAVWTLQHEYSPQCVQTVLDILCEIKKPPPYVCKLIQYLFSEKTPPIFSEGTSDLLSR